METRIAYFDESGDDGNTPNSSDLFILTSFCMPVDKWQQNYDLMKKYRQMLKNKYGFHVTQEMHTKNFLTDKNPYRNYGWSEEERRAILKYFAACIAHMDGSAVNVIIDKGNIQKSDYPILNNALTYNIQRIENTSDGKWNYLLVSDEGRIAPMRKTARAIRSFNPIQSMFDYSFTNRPIKYMVEDIFEKSSRESYFIQVCDYISYFVNLYYRAFVQKKKLPNRVSKLIDEDFVKKTMDYFRDSRIFNLDANRQNEYGLVIYPKK